MERDPRSIEPCSARAGTHGNPLPPLSRDDAGRTRADRRRTFRPNYVSFAGTYQCNLTCAHCCVPIEWTDRLDVGVAVRFLESAHAAGIRTLGFTGGEPFLYPEFLVALSRRGAELALRFDKVMTNGAWHRDPDHLRGVLEGLFAAGFSGRLGLSVDKFHAAPVATIAEFCRIARDVSRRDDVITLAYASRGRHEGLEKVRALAAALGGVLEWSPMLRNYLLVTDDLTMDLNFNHLAPVERAERLGGGWDGEWFEEDWCEGPGQALIVNPRGEVKPCCGFASDLDQLTIGNIHEESAQEIIENARRHPYVAKVFRDGLTAIRDEILARDPGALPGSTTNHCFFCWYALTRGLAAGVPGGGGQVGRWVGLWEPRRSRRRSERSPGTGASGAASLQELRRRSSPDTNSSPRADASRHEAGEQGSRSHEVLFGDAARARLRSCVHRVAPASLADPSTCASTHPIPLPANDSASIISRISSSDASGDRGSTRRSARISSRLLPSWPSANSPSVQG
jgi:pyruvate-formate lyase-activating enzyme